MSKKRQEKPIKLSSTKPEPINSKLSGQSSATNKLVRINRRSSHPPDLQDSLNTSLLASQRGSTGNDIMQKLLRKNGEHVTKSLQLSHLEQRKTLQLRSLGAIIDIKKEIQNLTQVSM